MREKTGITMEDYVILYNMEQIKWIWPEFFEKRVLYREVMYSRALSKSKKVFIKLLYRYK